MSRFPKELITHKYYQLLNITPETPFLEAFESIKNLYHEYHRTQFNIDLLYQQIISLTICYTIISDPDKRLLYNQYGDYLFDKIINNEHFDNKLLNYIFQNPEKNQEPFFIELPLEKMNSGTKLSIKYQSKCFSKKIINLEIDIPKRSKNYDILTITDQRNKIDIFLKQKKNSHFFVFGHNLLSIVDVSIYDTLLQKDYFFNNFYGNKITINLGNLCPWTINEYTNQGLFSETLKKRSSLFILFNIIYPQKLDYQSELLLKLLGPQSYQIKKIDIISILETIFKEQEPGKITPQIQQESTSIITDFITNLKKKKYSSTDENHIYKKMIYTILNNNYI